MKGKLPRVTAEKIIKILHTHGFIEVRQSGSHKIFRNSQGCRVTVPVHSGTILHPKLIKAILEDAGISPEELEK
ncbi:MAG TPA: addiction module toxin, HicA family [Methanolinea sp.]|jgi:predicted RNA binding protein YcfA (HicA-like mRNA interferase family)|nr:addiction module toxin, HicA family [Methanolinea sp.]HNQ30737.1 type II toxin-antitoxin system HicA family toxin [Methanolinea sp.]